MANILEEFTQRLDNAVGTNFSGQNPNGNLNRFVRGEGIGSMRLPTWGSEEFKQSVTDTAKVAALAAGGYYLYSAYGAAGVGAGSSELGVGAGTAEATYGAGYLGADIGGSAYASEVGASYLGVDAATLGSSGMGVGGSSSAGLGYLGVQSSYGSLGSSAAASAPWYSGLGSTIESTLTTLGTVKTLLGLGGGSQQTQPGIGGDIVMVPGPKGTYVPATPQNQYTGAGSSTTAPKGSTVQASAGGIHPIILLGLAGAAIYYAKKKKVF